MNSTPPSANGAKKATLNVIEQSEVAYILDTNIISYGLRRDTRAARYDEYLADKQAGISFQTVAEVRRWGIEHNWGPARRKELMRRIEQLTVCYVSDDVITAWAGITAQLRQKGTVIATADAWIAATAWVLDVPLVTHNHRHFAPIAGLQIVSSDNTDQ